MTARILVDAARIAYERDPEFSFVERMGDENLMKRFLEDGELSKEKGKGKVENSVIYDQTQGKTKGNL